MFNSDIFSLVEFISVRLDLQNGFKKDSFALSFSLYLGPSNLRYLRAEKHGVRNLGNNCFVDAQLLSSFFSEVTS